MTQHSATLPMEETETVQPVREMAMVPADAGDLSMFERLVRDPSVDVDKLQRLIDMQLQIRREQAKALFDEAFSKMQAELPVVDEKGQIVVEGVVRSRFAKHEDIQDVCKPIMAKYSFSIRHKNRRLDDGRLLIIGILSHGAGHREEDEFDCFSDTSGKKNDLQALGSSREYGRRYTTISLLNIVTRGVDNDAKNFSKPPVPEGYEAWGAILEAEARNGPKAYEQAWQGSRADLKTFMANHDKDRWNQIKATAQGAKGKGR